MLAAHPLLRPLLLSPPLSFPLMLFRYRNTLETRKKHLFPQLFLGTKILAERVAATIMAAGGPNGANAYPGSAPRAAKRNLLLKETALGPEHHVRPVDRKLIAVCPSRSVSAMRPPRRHPSLSPAPLLCAPERGLSLDSVCHGSADPHFSPAKKPAAAGKPLGKTAAGPDAAAPVPPSGRARTRARSDPLVRNHRSAVASSLTEPSACPSLLVLRPCSRGGTRDAGENAPEGDGTRGHRAGA